MREAALDQGPRAPLNPYLVLAAAILLPGLGYVLNGQVKRGLIMQLFMIALAIVTWHLAPPQASFIGKISGGVFIYALSIPDAYRFARLRWEIFKRGAANAHANACGNLPQN